MSDALPEEVLDGSPWHDSKWDSLAQAIERLTLTPSITTVVEPGVLRTVHAEGGQFPDGFLEDISLFMKYGQQMVAEMERLRVLVAASSLTLNADERLVSELVAAGIEMIQANDCGDDPSQELADVCPCCRMKAALHRLCHPDKEAS